VEENPPSSTVFSGTEEEVVVSFFPAGVFVIVSSCDDGEVGVESSSLTGLSSLLK
jgi:hypothetical protein